MRRRIVRAERGRHVHDGLQEPGGECGTGQLDHDVSRYPLPREVTPQREGDADRRVEVRPGYLPMNRMIASTISPGATTAAVRLIVFGKAWPIMPPPAATSTRKNVPSSSENRRRHSWCGSWKSSKIATIRLLSRRATSSTSWAIPAAAPARILRPRRTTPSHTFPDMMSRKTAWPAALPAGPPPPRPGDQRSALLVHHGLSREVPRLHPRRVNRTARPRCSKRQRTTAQPVQAATDRTRPRVVRPDPSEGEEPGPGRTWSPRAGREVVRRDHLDAGRRWAEGAGQRALRLHHQLARAAQVGPQVVVQHGGDPARAQQPGVVGVEVVGDEDRAGAGRRARTPRRWPGCRRRWSRRRGRRGRRPARRGRGRRTVASSPSLSGISSTGRGASRRSAARKPISRSSSPRKRLAAQRHQHVPGRSRSHCGDQVRRGGAGRPVVDADVGRRRRSVGRSVTKVTTGMPAAASRPTASVTSGSSGALSRTPCEPRRAIPSSGVDELGARTPSPAGGSGTG